MARLVSLSSCAMCGFSAPHPNPVPPSLCTGCQRATVSCCSKSCAHLCTVYGAVHTVIEELQTGRNEGIRLLRACFEAHSLPQYTLLTAHCGIHLFAHCMTFITPAASGVVFFHACSQTLSYPFPSCRYDLQPEAGTPEADFIDACKNPREWV